MSPRMAKTLVAIVPAFFCGLAAACVVPAPTAPPFPPGAFPAQTDLDRAYYFSTVNQEMVYAKLRQDRALAATVAAPSTLLPPSPAMKGCLSACPLPSTVLASPKSGLCPTPGPASKTPKPPHRK